MLPKITQVHKFFLNTKQPFSTEKFNFGVLLPLMSMKTGFYHSKHNAHQREIYRQTFLKYAQIALNV